MALHFEGAKVNWLTHDVGDPLIGTPEYKISAVRVEKAMSDSLAYESVDRHLKGRFGRPYTYVDECESTQLLLEGAPEGAVAACDVQTAGRGRYGSAWEAPAGTALLCSIVLHPPPERERPELTLVGAIAAAEAVEGATGLAAQIKWPNDVMLNRRKVCGVLGELRDGVVTLGIGINVNQTREQLPSDAHTPAASLRTITGRVRSCGAAGLAALPARANL